MSIFKDKVLLITGGTGSFGNAVLNRFLRTDIGEIRIFARDEKTMSRCMATILPHRPQTGGVRAAKSFTWSILTARSPALRAMRRS